MGVFRPTRPAVPQAWFWDGLGCVGRVTRPRGALPSQIHAHGTLGRVGRIGDPPLVRRTWLSTASRWRRSWGTTSAQRPSASRPTCRRCLWSARFGTAWRLRDPLHFQRQQREALGLVLVAESKAPDQVRRHFLTHSLVQEWVGGRGLNPSPELHGLARRTGVLAA